MECILHGRGDGPYINRCRMKDFSRVRSPVPDASQGVPDEPTSGQGSMLEQQGFLKKVDPFDLVPRPVVGKYGGLFRQQDVLYPYGRKPWYRSRERQRRRPQTGTSHSLHSLA